MTATASLLLGAALGLAHAVAGVVITRLAAGMAQAQFTVVVLGGTGLRMFFVLAVIVLLLLFTTLQTTPFMVGLGTTFVLGLLTEVILLLRRPPVPTPRA